MIYFLRHVETGYIKIGFTSNLDQRLQTHHQRYKRIELIGCVQGNQSDEILLHISLLNHRVIGDGWGLEWFYPSNEVMALAEKSGLDAPYPVIDIPDSRDVKTNFAELLKRHYGSDTLPSKVKIASDMGVTTNFVMFWLNGWVERPSVKSVTKICVFLDCDVGDLLYIDRSA